MFNQTLFACLLLPGAASAATIQGTIPRGPDGVSDSFPADAQAGDVVTWRVDLEASKDYAFVAGFESNGMATLRDAGGRTVMSFPVYQANEDYFYGHEFRATSTGAYFLELKVGAGGTDQGEMYWLGFQYDCLGGRRTRCTLPVNASRKSYTTFPYEWDWWKTILRADRRYDIAASAIGKIVVRDAKGRPVASADYDYGTDTPPTLRGFRPRVTGSYYVDVEGDDWPTVQGGFVGPYTVSLKAR